MLGRRTGSWEGGGGISTGATDSRSSMDHGSLGRSGTGAGLALCCLCWAVVTEPGCGLSAARLRLRLAVRLRVSFRVSLPVVYGASGGENGEGQDVVQLQN